MGSSLGRAFAVTTFGESHGGGLGVVIDGCPPGLRLDLARIQAELDRRRPGASPLASQRKERDRATVLSGPDALPRRRLAARRRPRPARPPPVRSWAPLALPAPAP